ncbi:NUDIX domain-containing protein [Streptomyces sp. NPDC050485]|uniref:NUDIX domain-containing protein n=1 Tax=Streptomyces sp. NPDC050485 TaxID=3365617 RepID=UPI0037AA883B
MTDQAARPTGAAALIVNSAGDYLLHLRDYKPGLICDPGVFSLLSGTPEEGESPRETLLRELAEEAGLVFDQVTPFALLPGTGPDGGLTGKGRIQIFLAHWDGDPEALRLTEGVLLRFFPAETLGVLRTSPWAAEAVRLHQQQLAHTEERLPPSQGAAGHDSAEGARP